MGPGHSWWQTGVIYQIYPRSFADASGDGTGDLRGIAGRLDYLEWLGVDAVWLSPFYPSPMADFGYDVSDHCGVDPLFGSLEDFDALLDGAHRRGIGVIIDFVPNHTSDEHPWFVESRSSRDNPKRNWYIWREPAQGNPGGPPNNWESIFGGSSAWEWDEKSRQYYLHTFDVKQPDLDWRNPEVRKAMYGVMRFWLDRGVDGFRIDALSFLIKDEQLRDNPPNPEWRPGDPPWTRQRRVYSDDRPEVLDVVREMRAVMDGYGGDRALIGELYLPLERLMAYYGTELDGIHLPLNFGLVLLPGWGSDAVGPLVERYEAALAEGAWPNWVLGNHDNPRIASRLARSRARVAHMLLLTLRGTPTCYYGDEIGMRDVEIPQELARDPQGVKSPGYGRDPARTPMQWDASVNAGFCPDSVEPWLPVADDHEVVNVDAQRQDPRSMLALFRRLIELRRDLPALAIGSYRQLDTGDGSVLAYLREHGEHRVLVVLNFGAERKVLDLSGVSDEGEVLCSTHLDRIGRFDLNVLDLRSDEGILVTLESST
jgi:alpha-glucosidase